MKIEDIDVIQGNLNQLKELGCNLISLNVFLERLKTTKKLELTTDGRYLNIGNVNAYEFAGKEIIKLLEFKKTILEKEIYNFSLDQLLPDKNNGIGIKFKNAEYGTEMFFKENGDSKYATISWYGDDGEIKNSGLKSHTIEECEYFFKTAVWIKL